MKKLIAILTTITLTTIPVIGIVSCGTATPNKIDGKKNIRLSFDLNKNIAIPEIKTDEVPDQESILKKVLKQSQEENKIPTELTYEDFICTYYQLNYKKKTYNNEQEYSKVVFTVKPENENYTGTLDISFKVYEIISIGKDEIVIVPPNQENVILDLTRFDVNPEDIAQNELLKFKNELINIASTNTNNYPNEFFNNKENFKFSYTPNTFKHNTKDQTIVFLLETIQPMIVWSEEKQKEIAYEGHFKITFKNAMSNKIEIEMCFDNDHPPTIGEFNEFVFEEIKKQTEGTDIKLNGAANKSYKDFYNFEKWNNNNIKLPKNFGESVDLPKDSIGKSKADTYDSPFNRKDNDIIVNGTINIKKINLDDVIDVKLEQTVDGNLNDDDFKKLESNIWDYLVEEATKKIKEKYKGYSQIPSILREYFGKDGQSENWVKTIKENLNSLDVGDNKEVELSAKIDSTKTSLFTGSLKICVNFIKNPIYITKEIAPIKIQKNNSGIEEIFQIVKRQIEKELTTIDKPIILKRNNINNLYQAIERAYKTPDSWFEYSENIPETPNGDPVAIKANGKINLASTSNTKEYKVDFAGTDNIIFWKNKDPDTQIVNIAKIIFNESIKQLSSNKEMEGISTLFDDWSVEKASFLEALKAEIDKSGNESKISFNKILNSKQASTFFTGSIQLTNLDIFFISS